MRSGWAQNAHTGGRSILSGVPFTWVEHSMGFEYWLHECLTYGSQFAPTAEKMMKTSQPMASHFVTRPRRLYLRGFGSLLVERGAGGDGDGLGSLGVDELGELGHEWPPQLRAHTWRTRGSIHA